MQGPASLSILEVLSGPCSGARTPLGAGGRTRTGGYLGDASASDPADGERCVIGNTDDCDLLIAASTDVPASASIWADARGVWIQPLGEGRDADLVRVDFDEAFEIAGVRCRVVREAVRSSSYEEDQGLDDVGDGADGAAEGRNDRYDRRDDLTTDATRSAEVADGAADDPAAAPVAASEPSPRSSLRQRATLTSIFVGLAFAVGLLLTDSSLFAMQKRAAATATLQAGRTIDEALADVRAQLVRAGVDHWVGADAKGDPDTPVVRLLIYTDSPRQVLEIRQRLTAAGLKHPAKVISGADLLAQVTAYLHGNGKARPSDSPSWQDEVSVSDEGGERSKDSSSGHDTVSSLGGGTAGEAESSSWRSKADLLQASIVGPGHLRLAGLVPTIADAQAVRAGLLQQFPTVRSIAFDIASSEDLHQFVGQAVADEMKATGMAGSQDSALAFSDLDGLSVNGAGSDVANASASPTVQVDGSAASVEQFKRQLAAIAARQHLTLALAVRGSTVTNADAGLRPRMIVMGPRPYAVLADGAQVFAGDVIGEQIVQRIERNAIRMAPYRAASS